MGPQRAQAPLSLHGHPSISTLPSPGYTYIISLTLTRCCKPFMIKYYLNRVLLLKLSSKGSVHVNVPPPPVCTVQCAMRVAGQVRMFSVQLTEQQQQIQDLCRDFAAEHLKPYASQSDKDALFPTKQVLQ